MSEVIVVLHFFCMGAIICLLWKILWAVRGDE
jgi:hypothetical protein